jgi:hypothetical protein
MEYLVIVAPSLLDSWLEFISMVAHRVLVV